jgi:hypothetical protein
VDKILNKNNMTAHSKYNTKKGGKIAYNSNKHYANKNEGQVLRRIMSRTGLSEEEVRFHPQFRKELSEAQVEGQKAKRTYSERWCHMIIKDACKETQLAKEHPKTIEVIDRILADRKSGSWGFKRAFRFTNPPENATILLRDYGKTYR